MGKLFLFVEFYPATVKYRQEDHALPARLALFRDSKGKTFPRIVAATFKYPLIRLPPFKTRERSSAEKKEKNKIKPRDGSFKDARREIHKTS